MVDLNGHEAGNGGHSQGKPKAYRDSSTRRDACFRQLTVPGNRVRVKERGRCSFVTSNRPVRRIILQSYS